MENMFQTIINNKYFDSLLNMILGIIIALIGIFVVRLVIKATNKVLRFRKVDPLIISFSDSVLRATLYIVLGLTVLSQMGIDITPLLTILGTAGIAVGFALRDSLSNLAGGILILIYRPFRIGDYIEHNGLQGAVKEISLLYTYLTTPDNKRIILSNGHLAGGNLINYSTEKNRRVDCTFGAAYNAPVEGVKEILLEIAKAHPLILNNQEIIIQLTKQSAHSIEFAFRVWVASENYWTVYYDIHEQVKVAFDQKGYTIPYQTLDFMFKNNG